MNVNNLLEDIILVQINNKIYNVDQNYQRQNINNEYVGLDHIFINSFLKTYQKNYIQLHHIGTSNLLNNFVLTDDEIKNCNTSGLEIFLTEQVYFQCGPGDELPIADFVNLKIDINFKEYPLYWQNCNHKIKSLELDSCKKFIINNNLKNVTVHLCNKDTKGLLNHYNFAIGNKNPFLQAMFNILKQTERNKPNADCINYKFWCGNWRYEPHRHIIAAYLSNFNTKLGWHFDGNIDSFEHFYWFKLDDWKNLYNRHYQKLVNGIDNLNRNHYFLDIKPKKHSLSNSVIDVGLRPEDNGEHPAWQKQIDENLYNDTFCSIVNLGSFADCFPTYDEKPLIAIRNYRPFILVGPPGSLQMMKDHGFKTFDNFWNESYDLEHNHEKRFIKIFDLIESIDQMSLDECKIMYKNMNKILKHNYNIISKGLVIK
jgi:hypothetical protein